jgi:hypothetical protein
MVVSLRLAVATGPHPRPRDHRASLRERQQTGRWSLGCRSRSICAAASPALPVPPFLSGLHESGVVLHVEAKTCDGAGRFLAGPQRCARPRYVNSMSTASHRYVAWGGEHNAFAQGTTDRLLALAEVSTAGGVLGDGMPDPKQAQCPSWAMAAQAVREHAHGNLDHGTGHGSNRDRGGRRPDRLSLPDGEVRQAGGVVVEGKRRSLPPFARGMKMGVDQVIAIIGQAILVLTGLACVVMLVIFILWGIKKAVKLARQLRQPLLPYTDAYVPESFDRMRRN